MAEQIPAVAEYVDANGNTWQLDEATAKRLGYKRVENKVITAEADTGSAAATKPSRRTATTK